MDVVTVARGELGFKEGQNNDTKYGAWFGLNNQPWCAMFVSWCFAQVKQSARVAAQSRKGFASCDSGLRWFTRKNKLIPIGQAQPGDIAFFQFDTDAQPDHVGIVVKNDGKKYIWCVEGNTSDGKSGSQANGDGVYYKKRAYSLVMAVARP